MGFVCFFNRVIMMSWLESRDWQVDSIYFFLSFFNWASYFSFNFFMGLSRSHDSDREFVRLTWFIFWVIFNWIFFFNLSLQQLDLLFFLFFKYILQYYVVWKLGCLFFFSIFFVWSYPDFMNFFLNFIIESV